MNTDSKLLCKITDHEILSIIRHVYSPSTQILSSTLLQGGKFNTTYRIQTEKPSSDIILRLSPVKQELLFHFEKKLMMVKAKLYKLLEKKGVPVPEIIYYDATKTLVPREFLITKFINGVSLEHVKLFSNEYDQIMYNLGIYINRIHSIMGEGFGWFNLEKSEMFQTWFDFLINIVEEIGCRSEKFGTISKKYIYKLQMVIIKSKPLFLLQDSHLVHHDLHNGNILISNDSEKKDISALIDIDRAFL
jgi:aminoglycoside phosphotransferase (APT) family kinase protein